MTDETTTNQDSDLIDDSVEDNAVPNEEGTVVTPTAEVVDDFAAATVAAEQRSLVNDEATADDFDFSFDATPNMHVTVDNPITKRQKLNPNHPYIAALKGSITDVDAIMRQRGLEDISEEQLEKLSREDRRLISLARTLSDMWQDVYFDDIDQKGNWKQAVISEGTRLGIGRFKVENMSDPVMAIRATFGQGTVIQVPLWNTGLWLNLRAPSLQELLDFEQRTRMEKMNLGRSTNGMVFSNIEVYTVETYMRFAMEHVISVNYQFETTDTVGELLSVIKNRDYQQIMLGLVQAMYPDGYPFRQPCVANPNKCDHIDELLINFARMGFVDTDKLTDKQVRMMMSRKQKKTRKDLEEYQAEFPFFQERIDLGRGVTAVLAVPSLQQQIDAGHSWVDGISKATVDAFGARLSEMDRVRHIMRSGAISSLRSHSHWIKHFEHMTDKDSEPMIIDDLVNKDRMLEMLSEDPEVSVPLTEKIIKWIQGTTVSYVGLPKSACPKCQKEPEDQSHPHLIPIDIGYVFFTLAALKISLVEGAAG